MKVHPGEGEIPEEKGGFSFFSFSVAGEDSENVKEIIFEDSEEMK